MHHFVRLEQFGDPHFQLPPRPRTKSEQLLVDIAKQKAKGMTTAEMVKVSRRRVQT